MQGWCKCMCVWCLLLVKLSHTLFPNQKKKKKYNQVSHKRTFVGIEKRKALKKRGNSWLTLRFLHLIVWFSFVKHAIFSWFADVFAMYTLFIDDRAKGEASKCESRSFSQAEQNNKNREEVKSEVGRGRDRKVERTRASNVDATLHCHSLSCSFRSMRVHCTVLLCGIHSHHTLASCSLIRCESMHVLVRVYSSLQREKRADDHE